MTLTQTLISVGVLFLVFLSIYSGARKQGLKESMVEIKDFMREIFSGGSEEVSESIGEVKRKW